jgi:hypothetical protein
MKWYAENRGIATQHLHRPERPRAVFLRPVALRVPAPGHGGR